ncbi:MAG: PspC domain-containing protein [Acidobacteria bacterium]|nr:PspC domain-containing protein [Acidobacteriota bacterium]
MFCTRCGVELRDQDRYCFQCGARTGVAPEARLNPPLMLDKRNKKIAGVCAGFARYAEIDVTLVRIVVLVLALFTGIGFIAYPIAWILMPSDQGRDVGVPAGAIQPTT